MCAKSSIPMLVQQALSQSKLNPNSSMGVPSRNCGVDVHAKFHEQVIRKLIGNSRPHALLQSKLASKSEDGTRSADAMKVSYKHALCVHACCMHCACMREFVHACAACTCLLRCAKRVTGHGVHHTACSATD
mmetsp:Transcript_21170/g.46085  ORF Transcript_21170/g.46085 Transcript_21170/m.46085 type:complete len:132 (-) Transcript_21170:745-1140(-)